MMKPLFVAEISKRITAGDFVRYDLGTGSLQDCFGPFDSSLEHQRDFIHYHSKDQRDRCMYCSHGI